MMSDARFLYLNRDYSRKTAGIHRDIVLVSRIRSLLTIRNKYTLSKRLEVMPVD